MEMSKLPMETLERGRWNGVMNINTNTPSIATPTVADERPILVVGATAKTGRRVAARLADRGIALRAVSRGTTPRFDWTDRSTWAEVLRGVGAVYLTYQPDLLVDGSLDDIRAFVALAEQAQVSRLVLLAGRGEPEASAAGAAVQASTIESTVLYCAWFNQNFDEGPFAAEVAAGSLTVPVGAVGEPFIDVDDIADVALASLLEIDGQGRNPHAGRDYELTGPRLLTFAEAATEIGRGRGTDIQSATVSLQQYRDILAGVGLPDEIVAMIATLFDTVFDGRNEYVTDHVQRVLGRPATDFADYAARLAVSSR